MFQAWRAVYITIWRDQLQNVCPMETVRRKACIGGCLAQWTNLRSMEHSRGWVATVSWNFGSNTENWSDKMQKLLPFDTMPSIQVSYYALWIYLCSVIMFVYNKSIEKRQWMFALKSNELSLHTAARRDLTNTHFLYWEFPLNMKQIYLIVCKQQEKI